MSAPQPVPHPAPDAPLDRATIDAWIGYHSRISQQMTAERTALASALIPVTPYIIISTLECYRRYPAMMREIAAAMDPAAIGAAGRRPGNQVDAVHLWSIINLPLLARQVLAPVGLLDPAADEAALAEMLRFWAPAAAAFRADGEVQAWDAGFVVPRHGPEVLGELLDHAVPVDDELRAQVARTSAALTSFLFLLYFDTRAGYQDTGPYRLDDGRVVLVRDCNEMGVSHFPWSAEVCGDLPHSNLSFAFVLRDVELTCNDWGTSVSEPADLFAHLDAVAIVDPTGGTLTPVPVTELAAIGDATKRAQKALYRRIAGMTRNEKIDAGAYVYFTFLRPFARVAGVEDALDWTVPRDSLDLYELIAMIDETPDIDPDPAVAYYMPLS